MTDAPTTIYSASAGSGKTFTLARDYLTLLFKHPFNDGYRAILAVTFTNKAVAEMKERILGYLHAFTKETVDPKLGSIYEHIKQETGFDDVNMRAKAVAVYQKLLHDYAAFDVVTIDAFSHRILRTFSKDLNLPDGFEVSLDADGLIQKAIARLIDRTAHDEELTKVLLSFSLEKMDSNRSWDIVYDLEQISKLLREEVNFKYLQSFKEKHVGDFLRFRESALKHDNEVIKSLQLEAAALVASCTAVGIEPADFKGGKGRSCFNDVVKIATGTYAFTDVSTGINNMEAGSFYANGLAQQKKDAIDSLQEPIQAFCERFNTHIGYLMFHKNILKNSVPLSLLNELARELDHIKREERIVPIFEFNGLLQNQIKDEPAPFIYERLGERYRHYFIDEFQDTSTMQWNNLKPLIENAVVQERLDGSRGSLMLVGDAKQSIYRWRGGDVDQFLTILGSDSLFGLPMNKQLLPKNYRSTDEVVTFNNEFFKLYATELNGAVYRNLYEEFLVQKTNALPHGYVQIDFLDPDFSEIPDATEEDGAGLEEDAADGMYPAHVLRQVHEVLAQGYRPGEICILVRTNKNGSAVAQHLVQNQIAVVSGESLLVALSPQVELLERLMQLHVKPDQEEPRYRFLMAYLQVHPQEDVLAFLEAHMHVSLDVLYETLFGKHARSVLSAFEQHSLFEATERVAHAMGLFDTIDTRLHSFMEFVYVFSRGFEVSLNNFLSYWDTKRASLSVTATENMEAVQIMTIHKAKGLEFPVVIVPYCDTKIDKDDRATTWVPVDPNFYNGFSHVYMSLNQRCNRARALGGGVDELPAIYAQHIEQTQLDHINTLYVAFTRAAKQLYILCKQKKGNGRSKTYGTLLEQFVNTKGISIEVASGYTSARFGEAIVQRSNEHTKDKKERVLNTYQVCMDTQRATISTRRGLLWASGAADAINKGTILHNYLAHLQNYTQLQAVTDRVKQDLSLSLDQQEQLILTLQQVVSPAYFRDYFLPTYRVVNEQPILLPDGKKLIPDRLLFKENQVTIVDYKTGAQLPQHQLQVDTYATTLTVMGYEVVQKVLLYTDQMNALTWS